MGRYTDRSIVWEVWQSFAVFFSLFIACIFSYGLFGPLIILLLSKRVSYSKWLKRSVIISVLSIVAIIMVFSLTIRVHKGDYILLLMFCGFYGFMVFMAFNLREYLERLDLRNYILLEDNVSYNYREVKDQFIDTIPKIEDCRKEEFLRMLKFFHGQIHNEVVLNDIDELIRLIPLIIEKDSNRYSFFFERYYHTIKSLLEQYIHLQDLYIENKEVIELRSKLVSIVALSRTAFENELLNMYENDILSIDGEAELYKNYLKSKGLV